VEIVILLHIAIIALENAKEVMCFRH